MKVILLAYCLLAAPSTFSAEVLQSMCKSHMPSLEELREILNSIGPLDGHDRVQCGLKGEDFKICLSCSDSISKEQMDTIRPMLATKAHRDWHFNWHDIRWKWNLQSTTDSQRQAWVEQGWVKDPNSFGAAHSFKDGAAASEDFFFMHREMIKMVQAKLVLAGLPCISG